MLAKPAAICAPCPLGAKGQGFSLPAGLSTSRLLFVGEALGEAEMEAGEPFVGAAGGMLSRLLALAKIERVGVRMDNVCRCRPPKNWLEGAPWEVGAIDWCSRHHLAETLRSLPPDSVVVPLGGTASRLLLQRTKHKWLLNNWNATVTRLEGGEGVYGTGGYWVVPTFHPSFLQRGATNLTYAVVYALQRAWKISQQGWSPAPYREIIDPPVAWVEQWVRMVEELSANHPWEYWLNSDIETPDKAKGKGEDELSFDEDRSYDITHVNFAIDPDEGVTFPYTGPYIALADRLWKTKTVKLGWNDAYDNPRIWKAGHTLAGYDEGKVWDLMWAAHVLQSDWPLGLGFWCPFYSDAPPHKHLYRDDNGRYRAFDGFQPLRIAYGMIPQLKQTGGWYAFERHIRDLDRFALKPAVTVGLQVDRDRLLTFKDELTTKAVALLDQIAATTPRTTLYPPQGLTKPPKPGALPPGAKPKKKGEAQSSKQQWVAERFTVVEREVERAVLVCRTCEQVGVTKTHKCPTLPEALALLLAPDQLAAGTWSGVKTKKFQPAREVVEETRTVVRWFYSEPLNVDSPKQLLETILGKGHEAGTDRKTQKATTNKKTLERLEKETADPFYRFVLDYRAVKKVLSTYVEGAETRMKHHDTLGEGEYDWSGFEAWYASEAADEAGAVPPMGWPPLTGWRLHAEITHRPATLRTSCVNPNLQNVVADKGGKATLAAGFRRVIRPLVREAKGEEGVA